MESLTRSSAASPIIGTCFLYLSRRDHWVQALGRIGRDRSATLSDDVAHSNNDNVQSQHCLHVEKVQETLNGQISENGSALNASEERPLQGSNLNEKVPITNCHAAEGQGINICGEVLGKAENVTEGEHQKAWPLEVTLPHNNILNSTNTSKAYAASGQHDLKVASMEMGQRISGPILSAKKVYVRRKEVLGSNCNAQQTEKPIVDFNPASKSDPLPSLHEDTIELQCALLKEMGLSYGEDDNRVKGLLLDMENKDDMMAAEKGNKIHQL